MIAQGILSPASLLLLLVSNGMAATDCFTQVGDSYSKPAGTTRRISVGIACPPSDNNVTCPLTAEGYFEEAATLNITTQSRSEIFDAVRTDDRTFEDSVKGRGPTLTYPVDPGRMGYYGFTVHLRCFAGTLGDCIGADVEAGTHIEACAPMTLLGGTPDEIPTFDGTGAFVQTDDISEMSTNPSATAMPAGTNETEESSATPKLLQSGTLFCMILLATLGFAV
ncbi:MAG: hypothetical protein L6R35_003627 [Caloplaca aegaea]|nr:MAG: hypothetical protein L6R35_003627 [Caloplaca aegaea]